MKTQALLQWMGTLRMAMPHQRGGGRGGGERTVEGRRRASWGRASADRATTQRAPRALRIRQSALGSLNGARTVVARGRLRAGTRGLVNVGATGWLSVPSALFARTPIAAIAAATSAATTVLNAATAMGALPTAQEAAALRHSSALIPAPPPRMQLTASAPICARRRPPPSCPRLVGANDIPLSRPHRKRIPARATTAE